MDRLIGVTDRLKNILESYIADGAVGASLSVHLPGCEPRTFTAGLADKVEAVPIRPDHLFKIGSCTKTFIAVALCRMAEDGLINLRASAGTWFPKWQALRGVTVLQLINHRSGLPEFEHDIPMDAGRNWAPEDMVDIAFSHYRPEAPGGPAVYNNTGYVLAGLILESISGRALGDVVRKAVLQPAGLANTWSPATEAFPVERMVRGYYARPPSTLVDGDLSSGAEMWRMDGVLPKSNELQDSSLVFPFSAGFGCGDMVATTSDMVTFLRALFSERLLSRRSIEILVGDRRPVSFPGTRMVEAGAGLFASAYADRLMLGHQGSIPGYVSVMQHDPVTTMTVALSTNVGSGNRLSFEASGLHAVVDHVVSAVVS